jgi:hypothetical protein
MNESNPLLSAGDIPANFYDDDAPRGRNTKQIQSFKALQVGSEAMLRSAECLIIHPLHFYQ